MKKKLSGLNSISGALLLGNEHCIRRLPTCLLTQQSPRTMAVDPNLFVNLLHGDALQCLKSLAAHSVQTCITSPAYLWQRDYRTATWRGGRDPNCNHLSDVPIRNDLNQPILKLPLNSHGELEYWPYHGRCSKCGATSFDLQVGIEATVSEYINRLVVVFRELRRVLKPDGTFWLNMNDTYCTSARAGTKTSGNKTFNTGRLSRQDTVTPGQGLAECGRKQLLGIPWQLALALQADGWILRCDIIWHKPSVTPESVKDRPTRSHEYLFLFSKSEQYYYDAEVVAELTASAERRVSTKGNGSFSRRQANGAGVPPSGNALKEDYVCPTTRNRRSVWTIPAVPCKLPGHFAAFPPNLVQLCILAGSREGDVTLDMFAGSGTTGLVALTNRRSFIGCELKRQFVDGMVGLFKTQHGIDAHVEEIITKPPKKHRGKRAGPQPEVPIIDQATAIISLLARIKDQHVTEFQMQGWWFRCLYPMLRCRNHREGKKVAVQVRRCAR
jgi:DNA modification methylase